MSIQIRLSGPKEEIEDFLRRLPNIRYNREELVMKAEVPSLLKDGAVYQYAEWRVKEKK